MHARVLSLAVALALPRLVAAQEADSTLAGGEPTETVVSVDTILVVEERRGLVWGDWYVSPEVSTFVHRVIERRGQLSGRTWMEAAVPVRDLTLGSPRAATQQLAFVDKGVALNFWEPGEVEYHWVFEGPWNLRARGVAVVPDGAERVTIPLPLPTREGDGEERERLGRLDVTYRHQARSGVPRGDFSVYLFFVEPGIGYRIAGVGY